MLAESLYARTVDGTHVAYQVTGSGPVDIVLLRGWVGDIEHEWADPVLARVLRRMSSFGRLIRLDRRGMGLSDRVIHRRPPTLEERVDDIRAVLDAVGSRRAVLVGLADGSTLAAPFAAIHPERTSGLVMYAPVPRWTASQEFPLAPTAAEFTASLDALRTGWGTRELAYRWANAGAPSRATDERFVEWIAEQQRRAGSSEDAVAQAELHRDTDITATLPAIHVPTLVVARHGEQEVAQYVAERIPNARLVILDGNDHFVISGDTDSVVREIENFVDAIARGAADAETDRVLATVLFTDIVGSTEQATEMGDRSWSELLSRFHDRSRGLVEGHRGRVVDMSGDGIFASFDGPGRAIRCSEALLHDADELGLGLRAGLHTGECELAGVNLRGIAVHIGARVAGLAERSEVLVTQTVKDLVSGGGFQFVDRGSHRLKGVADEWRVYAVDAHS